MMKFPIFGNPFHSTKKELCFLLNGNDKIRLQRSLEVMLDIESFVATLNS